MKYTEKNDILSYFFVISVSLFISSFFVTRYQHVSLGRQSYKTVRYFKYVFFHFFLLFIF